MIPLPHRHCCGIGRCLYAASMNLDAQLLRDEIAALGPWHHDVEVAPGVRTAAEPERWLDDPELGRPGILDPFKSIAVLDPLYPRGLENRSFLDCGCNAGGYIFAAKQRGAGRCFGFDARDHWVRQARFLARHLPSEDVSFTQATLNELPTLGLEPFDICWFSGLFYHLPDPIAGLKGAADMTRELLVLNTATLPRRGDALILNFEGTTQLMSGVDRLAWLPTGDGVLRRVLAWCGFPHAHLVFHRPTNHRFHRLLLLAAREETTLAPFAGMANRRGQSRRLTSSLRRMLARSR